MELVLQHRAANGSFRGWFIPSVLCEEAFWEGLALYAVSSENQNKAEWTFPRKLATPSAAFFCSGGTADVKICSFSVLILLACLHPQGRFIIATQKKLTSVRTFARGLCKRTVSDANARLPPIGSKQP